MKALLHQHISRAHIGKHQNLLRDYILSLVFRMLIGVELILVGCEHSYADQNYFVPPPSINREIVNLNSENIGGRTNPLANCVQYYPETDQYILTSGTGEKRIYESNELNPDEGAYRLERVEDPNGNNLTYTYQSNPALNGYGHISRIINSSGNWADYAYDSSDRIISVTASDGRDIHYTYDENGDLWKVTRPDETIVEYQYEDHKIVKVIKPEDEILENTYDDEGRTHIQKTTVGTDDTLTVTANISYAPEENMTMIVDAKEYGTQFTYDDQKRLTLVQDEEEHEQTYDWDEDNNPETITDRNDHSRVYTYDANGNILTDTNPRGKTTTCEYNTFNLVTKIIPPEGGETRFEYDSKGNLTSKKRYLENDTLYEETTYHLNEYGEPDIITVAAGTDDAAVTYLEYEDGKVTSITNAEGEETILDYDERGNLTSITNEEGETTTFVYNIMNRLEEIIDPLEHSVSYEYDPNGNLTSMTDALNNVFGFTYDKSNNLIKTEDPLVGIRTFTRNTKGEIEDSTDQRGNQTHYLYDLNGKVTQITDAAEHTASIGYDAVGNLHTVVDKRGKDTTYDYYDDNLLHTITDDDNNIYTLNYDDVGHVNQTVDKKGNITHYGYDDMGRLESVVYKDPTDTTTVSSMSFTYDKRDNVHSRTDGRGNATYYEYDGANRLIKVTDPRSAETEYGYDDAGRLTDIINDDDVTVMHVEYDEAGRPIEIVDGEDNSTTYGYDYNNNVTDILDPRNNPTTFEYDPLNRIKKIIDSGDGITEITRDPAGNITRITDAKGNIFDYSYDEMNRVIKIIDGERRITYIGYDENGNRTSITDHEGNETVFTYDNLNRLSSVEDALDNVTSYLYDANGNLQYRTDGKENVTEYQYDPLNRLTYIIYSADSSKNVTYVHDANGNLTSATGPTGTLSFSSYNENNQLTAASSPLGTIGYDYDLLGNKSEMTYPQNLRSLTYEHDSNHRLKKIITPAGDVEYGYDGNGNCTGITNPNGTSTTSVYDSLNRLQEIDNITSSMDVIAAYEFTINAIGNRTNETLQIDSGTPVQKEYGYDRVSQLIQEKVTAGETVDFLYDPRGNRKLKSNGTSSIGYQYNQINELLKLGTGTSALSKNIAVQGTVSGATSVTVNATPVPINNNQFEGSTDLVGGINTITTSATNAQGKQTIKQVQVTLVGSLEQFEYDANGNLTSRTNTNNVVTEYAYDFENRLKEVKYNGTTIASYTYDALGRRDSKTVSGVTTKYVYDGLTFNPILELNGDNTVKAIITRGPDMGGGIGGIISVVRGGEEYWYHYNHRGDVCALTDDEENIVRTYHYDAFGNIIASTGSVENPYRFSTKPYDEETGLYYFGFRYYSPMWSLFISQDPVRYVRLNQYTYTATDFSISANPSGLGPQLSTWGAFAEERMNAGIVPGQGVDEDLLWRPTNYKQFLWAFNGWPLNPEGRELTPLPYIDGSLYRYAINNPHNIIDPYGDIVWVDTAIGAGIGAAVGLGMTAVGDLIAWDRSSWQEYLGNTIGGAAGGACFTINPFIAGATAGAVSSTITQTLTTPEPGNSRIRIDRVLGETILGGTTSAIGAKVIPRGPGRPARKLWTKIFGRIAQREKWGQSIVAEGIFQGINRPTKVLQEKPTPPK